MEERKMVFTVRDDQETWLFEDIESALEHIRAGIEDGFSSPNEGNEYTVTVKFMTRAEIDAIPEQ